MTAELVKELTQEVNLLSHVLRKAALNRHLDDSLPPAALHILQLLKEHGALTVPEIGRVRLTSRQNIQIAVNRLRAFKWIEHVPNPLHKRSSLVRLTAAGEAALSAALDRESGQDWAASAAISDEEISAATGVLRRVRQAIQPSRRTGMVRRQKRPASIEPSPISSAAPENAKASGSVEPEALLEEMPVSLL